jgi:hypothetical protein
MLETSDFYTEFCSGTDELDLQEFFWVTCTWNFFAPLCPSPGEIQKCMRSSFGQRTYSSMVWGILFIDSLENAV